MELVLQNNELAIAPCKAKDQLISPLVLKETVGTV